MTTSTTIPTTSINPLLNPLQKKTILSIVNLFETDTIRGDYGSAICMKGDSGGLTYGRSQTTLNSGNLLKLLEAYCETPGARLADAIRPYLPRVRAKSQALNYDRAFRAILRSAGNDDPVMRACQDRFFDAVYWLPALRRAEGMGLRTALGVAVVYDSTIHGSFGKIATRTDIATGGGVRVAGEKAWVRAYLKTRRSWLLRCRAPLPNTVYRMDELRRIADAGNWDLALPLTVRGKALTADSMGVVEEAAGEDGPAASSWKLLLNAKELGATWQRPEDDFRNYFPARDLYEALFPAQRVAAGLTWREAEQSLYWEGGKVGAPALLRGEGEKTAAWAQLRGLAGALGLHVERDAEKRTLTLTRVPAGRNGLTPGVPGVNGEAPDAS